MAARMSVNVVVCLALLVQAFPVSLAPQSPSACSPITIGQTIAGAIAVAGEEDCYTFTAAAGQAVYFDAIASSASEAFLSWRLRSPSGLTVFEPFIFMDQRQTLAEAGLYTLIVDGYQNTTSTYRFKLWNVPPADQFAIQIGDEVSNGVPGAGAGNIETPGAEDRYTFTAAAGQEIYLDALDSSASPAFLSWRIQDSHGNPLYQSLFFEDQAISLSATGDYTLVVNGYEATTSTYQFRLLDVTTSAVLPLNTPLNIFILPEYPRTYQINVPSGTPNLFVRLQKTEFWKSEIRLYQGGVELASALGHEDPIFQAPAPAAGTYSLTISGEGLGLLTASTSLPALVMGQWKTGEILREYGSAWYQVQVPAGQSALNIRAEAVGLFSQLDLMRSRVTNPPIESSQGPTMQVAISAPAPGLYYLHLTDSAVMIGSEQARDHMIKADVQPVTPPPCSAPVITNFIPAQGGKGNPVTVSISGQCLAPEAAVCLARQGSSSVCAQDVAGAEDRRTLNARFDLSSTAAGSWTLRVTNPSFTPVLAPAPFMVLDQGEAQLWIEITGREQIRIGRFQTYHIEYGNSGPVDAYDVLFNVSVPASWEIKWEMPHPDAPTIDWDTISSVVESGSRKIIPFWLLKLGAGSQSGFDISLKIPLGDPGETFELGVDISQVDSEFARSGDLADIGSSPVFGLMVQAIQQAFESARPPAGRPAALAVNTSLDTPPEKEISKSFKDFLYSLLIPTESVVGGAVGGYFAYLLGVPLLPWIGAGMAIGGMVGLAMAVFQVSRAHMKCFQFLARLFKIKSISSVSPEDKYGPSGYDPAGTPLTQLKRWIPASRAIAYRIDFWNKEDAPAATQDVIITDQLDPDLDWSSFRFTEVGFLDWRATIEPAQYFNLDIAGVSIDLSPYYPGEPVIDLVVNVEGTFDPSTGAIEWQFHALDPLTRDYPENPYAGFLPPYTASGWEIGWANFSVSPKAGAGSGTAIQNQSFVKFDLNEFKPAPKAGPFLNTLDAAAPLAAVKSPTGAQACSAFLVAWTAKDEANGSGVGGVDVYVDDLGDAAPPYLWLAGAGGLSAVFRGLAGHSYGFYALARDHAGNLQAAPSSLKYDVQASAGSFCIWMPLARTRPR